MLRLDTSARSLLVQHRLDLVDDAFERARRERTLLAGLANAEQQLLARVLLAPPVLLDDEQPGDLRPLVGREAFAAGVALATAPDAVVGLPRVDDA